MDGTDKLALAVWSEGGKSRTFTGPRRTMPLDSLCGSGILTPSRLRTLFRRLPMLGIIIYILLTLAILGTILIGLGVGIGYLLWAILPGIELGMAIVAGAVFAVGLLDLFRRLMASMKKQQKDSEAEAALGDKPLVVMPRSLLERTPSGRTKRRRPR